MIPNDVFNRPCMMAEDSAAICSACGGTIYAGTGYITSPFHPGEYGDYVSCTWTLQVPVLTVLPHYIAPPFTSRTDLIICISLMQAVHRGKHIDKADNHEFPFISSVSKN